MQREADERWLDRALEEEFVEAVLRVLRQGKFRPGSPWSDDEWTVAAVAVSLTALEHEDCPLHESGFYQCQVPDAFDVEDPFDWALKFGYRAELFFDFLSAYLQRFPLRDWSAMHPDVSESLTNGELKKKLLIEELEKVLAPDYTIVDAGLVLPTVVAGTRVVVEEPALADLGGRGWERAVAAFSEAEREIRAGRYADAVTDVGTGLQEALAAAGYRGGTLGDQLKAAKTTQFKGTETRLGAAILELGGYIAAIRNIKSDAHHGAQATKADAELALRVALSTAKWLSGITP
ncbi:hypothetical protein [Rhodococcus qingshengii]|uniref:hypothetical protein n=1 Tax=Rhodococcus qingshengii TaxID=334542 RepID=UPI001C230C9D|nr:hypothetical protein [Rhodococcus qingshengii]QXC46707.1 hypothetical protein KSE96_31980 [Rhodococcus qingshengii]